MASPLLSRQVQGEAASPIPPSQTQQHEIDSEDSQKQQEIDNGESLIQQPETSSDVDNESNRQEQEAINQVFFGVDNELLAKDDTIPDIFSRAGVDEGDVAVSVKNIPGRLFPFPPSGVETDQVDLVSLPDVNVYQHKKTLAQGMMDLALFSANANQLRYVLDSSSNHPYFYPSLVFITISVILQVAIGAGLVWNATYNVKDEKEICIANKINNFTVVGIFLVTVINVFICAFGVAVTPVA